MFRLALVKIKTKKLIKLNSGYRTRDIAEILPISHMSVVSHLKTFGCVNHQDCLDNSQFNDKNLMDLTFLILCSSATRNNPFLKRTIIGDKKWIIYSNIARNMYWGNPNEPPFTTTKAGVYSNVILCIWWDLEGQRVQLPQNQSLNSDKYRS